MVQTLFYSSFNSYGWSTIMLLLLLMMMLCCIYTISTYPQNEVVDMQSSTLLVYLLQLQETCQVVQVTVGLQVQQHTLHNLLLVGT